LLRLAFARASFRRAGCRFTSSGNTSRSIVHFLFLSKKADSFFHRGPSVHYRTKIQGRRERLSQVTRARHDRRRRNSVFHRRHPRRPLRHSRFGLRRFPQACGFRPPQTRFVDDVVRCGTGPQYRFAAERIGSARRRKNSCVLHCARIRTDGRHPAAISHGHSRLAEDELSFDRKAEIARSIVTICVKSRSLQTSVVSNSCCAMHWAADPTRIRDSRY
jgi:hypothetical protein